MAEATRFIPRIFPPLSASATQRTATRTDEVGVDGVARKPNEATQRGSGQPDSGLAGGIGWSAVVLGGAALGFVGVFLYAMQFDGDALWSALGVSVVVALASMVVGGITGLLFGVPKTQASERAPSADDLETRKSPAAGSESFASNTNLEDVSDWLTKIIIGVGLVQIGAIGSALLRLGDFLAPALGGRDSSAAFAVGLVLYFLAVGFLLGYLLTKRYMETLFAAGKYRAEAEQARQATAEAQQETAEARQKAAHAVEEYGDLQLKVREVADQQAATEVPPAPRDLEKLADEYTTVRRTQPSGFERTRALLRLMAEARATAQQSKTTTEELRALHREVPGGRVVSLGAVEALEPSPELFPIVIQSIAGPRSAFEQYEALRALDHIAPVLSELEQKEACRTISDQRSGGRGKWIKPGTDRWALSERIVQKLRCQFGLAVGDRVSLFGKLGTVVAVGPSISGPMAVVDFDDAETQQLLVSLLMRADAELAG